MHENDSALARFTRGCTGIMNEGRQRRGFEGTAEVPRVTSAAGEILISEASK